MPELPPIASTIVPDWVCEILSPTTRHHNQLIKIPYYAKVGVKHIWLVDLEARTLTSHRLENERWSLIGTFSAEAEARIEPFAEVPLDVSSWWV